MGYHDLNWVAMTPNDTNWDDTQFFGARGGHDYFRT